MYKAKIFVNYKPSVLDPKATVIKQTLSRLGQTNIDSVLVGKYFELTLAADSEAAARTQVDQICDEMLANVNMESYRFDLAAVTA